MKKWHRLRAIADNSGIQLEETENPSVLFSCIQSVYKSPCITFKDNIVIVDGMKVKQNKFQLKVCLFIESTGQINQNIYSQAVHEVARKNLLHESKRITKRLEKRTQITLTNNLVIGNTKSSVFYSLPEWQKVRYQAIEKYGNKCHACGRSPKDGVTLHVDHIKPRSLNPELALDLDNLQILCADCNLGKSNKFSTDWRVA
jgi:5-methylcytosine-specific restriction endonuclease McrA